MGPLKDFAVIVEITVAPSTSSSTYRNVSHTCVKRHHKLAAAIKLKSAASGKGPNDHKVSEVTITKKSVLEVSCNLLSEK